MKIIKKHYSSKGLVFPILGIRISISKNSRLFSLIAKPRISVIVPVYKVENFLGKGGIYMIRKFFGIILLAIAARLFTANITQLLAQFSN